MSNLDDKIFARVLRQFADDPDEVIEEKGMVLCRINGTDLSLSLSFDDDGVLYCDDGRRKIKARVWIEKNLARLDVLAARILTEVEEEEHFVPVPSKKELASGAEENCRTTTDVVFEDLKQSNFFTSAIYLLSNAGDGKTMVMNRLARMTANAYREGKIHFIFLPIELGGRPFMRFDDLFIGELARKYRFRDYYFGALIELVKLGFVVLGLDGFEEMSVEGKDDKVISSLGELLSLFDSCGKIVVSARTAFYNYALENRVAIGDVMQRYDIEFSAYRLEPWTTSQFRELMSNYGINEKESAAVLGKLTARLGPSHPILTRPVLAHRLVRYIYESNGEYSRDLDSIGAVKEEVCQSKVLDDFVGVLLRREATEKWLSKSNKEKGGSQLLKLADHYVVLQSLAEEMWLSRTEFVKIDFLKDWMGVVCDQLGIGVAETRDCQEKILYHALLKADGTHYAFCHEAFAMYFLGRQIACLLAEEGYGMQLLQLLSLDVLSDAVVDEAAYHLSILNPGFDRVCKQLHSLKGGVSKNTPLGQNIGSLLMAYRMKAGVSEPCVFQDLYFSRSTMYGVALRNVRFEHCYFEALSVIGVDKWEDVVFTDSIIESIEIASLKDRIKDVVIDEESIPTKIIFREDDIYSPAMIREKLAMIGAELPEDLIAAATDDAIVPSEELSVFLKIVKLFTRTYYVTETLLSLKFGGDWSRIQKDILPVLIKHGLLALSERQRSGSTIGYRLGVAVSKIVHAQKVARGDFKRFLSDVKHL
ncbi:MAG: hypothetical protein MJZ42_05460 [Bacteroidales bacterium]|nr:hypothetical protein [Bacteroidales bacterium]